MDLSETASYYPTISVTPCLSRVLPYMMGCCTPLLPLLVSLEYGRVLLHVNILLDDQKAKPRMLVLYKSQGSKLIYIKEALSFTIFEVLVEELLLALETLGEGFLEMKAAALDFFIKDGLKGSELIKLKVHNAPLWPKGANII
ncbi:hypothetical protein DSO57_1034413 [Entomophthora muscae]|uniref:Uncharacterized protein n=1 Tax=Entomophthora muscae TaxID=34485 RepID=A0ACC2U8V6_9FUNG|nr:hypothetical protein DSO57_1034413 [Entomophthora muscae]